MRILLLIGWLMLPIVALAYHYGPGQERLQMDGVAAVLAVADRHAARAEWSAAAENYDKALKMLPPENTTRSRRIRLERAKAQMLAKKLPTAHEELKLLVEELSGDKNADQRVLAQARSSLASAQYYMTWLMRLEGLARDVWEPEIEAARQNYRLLAEQAESAGDSAAAKQSREDLESTIRLARLDLSELQGLPLPSQ